MPKDKNIIDPLDASLDAVAKAVVTPVSSTSRVPAPKETGAVIVPPNRRKRRAMATTICLFNHKGGVSKTTTSFNLGWVLAELKKKVLIVDLDSQCNLTGLVLGFDAIDEESMEGFYASRSNLTMKPIVEALINGLSPQSFMEQDQGNLHKTKHDNLFLLPGHLDTADLDSQISVSLKIASGVPATRNIPGNLPRILQLIANKYNIDYVIYDLSPNVGGLNEVMLMSSDYFIVPTSPDYFCLQAIGSLNKNIYKWYNEIKQFKQAQGFEDGNYPIGNNPVFLGEIQQRYRPRNEKPATSFANWITQIRESINDTLVPTLSTIGCVIDKNKWDEVFKDSGLSRYDLAQIPDFNSLIAISQHLSKPIFTLSDAEIKDVGKVFGHAEVIMESSRNNFAKIFNSLGERILELTS
jgi:cellulose biosynthesis protein BcsQ